MQHAHIVRTSVLVAAIVAAVVSASVAAWYFVVLVRPVPVQITSDDTPVNTVPTTRSAETKVLIMGDVFVGRYVNAWSQASAQKYAYPFQGLSEFNRNAYDAWVANLECPVTNNPKVSAAVEESTLKFDCAPEYLAEANKWFTAVSLGNNHTDNQGVAGFAETKRHLDENGIQYFGSYAANDYGNICDVVSLPARVAMSDGTTKNGKLPLVWCGYDGVFQTPNAKSIAVIAKYAPLFGVVVMPHSGTEYRSEPDAIKTTFYRALIDTGADVVLGGHPHWIQSTESYKGKLIVYSMGNFIFDQLRDSELTRGALISMDVTVDATMAPDFDKWLALGETCGAYADDCLAKATGEGLAKLPLQYHFSVLGSRNDTKATHRASETELAGILQRMNWQETIQELSGNSSGE